MEAWPSLVQALGIDKKDEKKKKEEEQKKKDEKKKEEEEAGHFGFDWYYLWFIPDECVGPTLKANSGEGAACQEDWAQGLEDHAASKSLSNFLPSSIAVTITTMIVRWSSSLTIIIVRSSSSSSSSSSPSPSPSPSPSSSSSPPAAAAAPAAAAWHGV